MIVIGDGRTDVVLRADRPQATKSFQRRVALSPTGELEVTGDHRWNGTTLEIRATITGTTPAAAKAALDELMSVARAASRLEIDGQLVLVHGLTRARKAERPTGWVVTLELLAATSLAGVGANTLIHRKGEVITGPDGQPLTFDPFDGSITADHGYATSDTTAWTADNE